MTLFAHPQNNDYSIFTPLIELSDESSLEDLIPRQTPPQQVRGMSSLIQSFLQRPKEEPPAELLQLKGLKIRLKAWNDILDEHSDLFQNDLEKLKQLHDLAKTLFQKGVTGVLRSKVKQCAMGCPKLEREIKRMDRLLNRILRLTTQKPTLMPFFRPLRRVSSNALLASSPMQSFLPPPPLDLEDPLSFRYTPEYQDPKDKSWLYCSIIADRFKTLVPPHPDWESRLISTFRIVQRSDEVKAASVSMTAMQVEVLLQNAVEERSNRWKIPFLLGSLPLQTLQELVLALSDDSIATFSELLKETESAARHWLDQQFIYLRDQLEHQRKQKKYTFEQLAKRFRDDPQGRFIRFSDIQDVTELADEVIIQLNFIQKLQRLFLDSLEDRETRYLLSEVESKYRIYKDQLMEEDPSKEPNGNIYGIICREVFENNEVDDEDEAIDILGAWSICHKEDYIECGLVPEPTEDEAIAWAEKPTLVFNHGKERLTALGIQTIADFKRLHIYNRAMLKDYLKRQR